jgi:hypothetical protein
LKFGVNGLVGGVFKPQEVDHGPELYRHFRT